MARINLLPWRAERQKQRQKQFMSMLALSALAGLALWFMVDRYYDMQIDGQRARNAFLDQQIAEAKSRTQEIELLEQKKSRLLSRKKVIEELQGNRSQMVHLFDSLVRTIPDGVTLTSIKQEADTLTLEGRTQSNARISTYMRNFESSGWMTSPDLAIIEAKGEDKGLPYIFRLTVKLTNPNATVAGKPAAPAVAGAAPTALQPLSPATPAVVQPAPAAGPAAAAPAQPAPGPASPATAGQTPSAAGGKKP
ncbi:MAG: PilN domain-containing protein [Xanthomonadaceae bacterium]|nr:PilN domain-containing protein [Xanthomonadaceae bacterium]